MTDARDEDERVSSIIGATEDAEEEALREKYASLYEAYPSSLHDQIALYIDLAERNEAAGKELMSKGAHVDTSNVIMEVLIERVVPPGTKASVEFRIEVQKRIARFYEEIAEYVETELRKQALMAKGLHLPPDAKAN